MQTQRKIGHAPRTQTLATRLQSFEGGCIGCPGCTGICQALLDVMLIPELVTGEDAR